MERRLAADQVRLVEVLRAGVNGIIICAVREARRLLDEGLHVKGDLPTGGTPNWNWPQLFFLYLIRDGYLAYAGMAPWATQIQGVNTHERYVLTDAGRAFVQHMVHPDPLD
jgi:hypothetical protein